MKKLLLGLILASSFAASAQNTETCTDCILDCYQTEPFVTTQYDFRKKVLVVSDNNFLEPAVTHNVSWVFEGMDEGELGSEQEIPFYTLRNKDNAIILELYKDGEGSDGMSEEAYEFSAFDSSNRTVGCSIREKRSDDPIANI